MSITLTLGWWILPSAITIAAFFAAWCVIDPNQRELTRGLDAVLFGGLALIVSLIAWLVWSVLK